MAAARDGAECASISTSRVWISAMRCGSCAVSASSSSCVRSVWALSTTSSRLSGPLGASCASRPMRQRGGNSIVPCSAPMSPVMTLNSVDLPVPLRPTSPTREPGVIRADAFSSSARPAMRTVRSSMTSMRALWPSARADATLAAAPAAQPSALATALPLVMVSAGPLRSRVRSFGSASTFSIAPTMACAASGSPR